MSVDAFSPDGLAWAEISPRWITLKRLHMAISWLVLTALVSVPLFLFLPDGLRWIASTVLATGVSWMLFRLTRAPRLRRAWGYAERGEDLMVRHGIWWRSLTAVPYGRMQVVEVESGPFEQALGLARVKLVTAASSTDAEIEGLEAADAARLRERLTALGQSRTAGL